MSQSKNIGQVNREAREIWNENAYFWDDHMGEGNAFQLRLIGPAIERMLNMQPGRMVLEIACGNGNFSRRLAQLGARVVAFDFSEKFIERARLKNSEYAGSIEYHVIDATDEAALLRLGTSEAPSPKASEAPSPKASEAPLPKASEAGPRFDAAVCNMALMDMAAIDPLLQALRKLLKPQAPFIFSVTHPCFNGPGITKIVEEEDRDGEIITTYAVKVLRYKSISTSKGVGVIGQPAAQYYFHRTLSDLLNSCFAAGFALDALEEPAFEGDIQGHRPFSWANFSEIPPVLVARLVPRE
jgi:SAM-dependent methyltransferase